MSQLKKIIGLAVLSVVIAGCGLRGDLYLPEAQPQIVDTPVQNNEIEPEASEAVEIPEVNKESK